jgi:putative ABC transport system substrate-binding protein
MNKKFVCLLLLTTVLAFSFRAHAQQAKKLPRIGYLSAFAAGSEPNKDMFEAFHQGLRELGWVPGQNVNIAYRWADGKYDRLPELAAELVRLNVDVIYAPTMVAARAVKGATTTTPVVFAGLGDPVSIGLVAGLARLGGNLTGLGGLTLELSGKRLELLKEVVPNLTRVAVLANPSHVMTAPTIGEVKSAAGALGLRIQVHEVGEPGKIEAAFAAMTKQQANGLMVLQDPMFKQPL